MSSTYTYTDSDGDTLSLETEGDVAILVKNYNSGEENGVFVSPEQALQLALALVATIPDYDHSKSLSENNARSLEGVRKEVMLDAGYLPSNAFDSLTAQEKSLIDAVLELKYPNA